MRLLPLVLLLALSPSAWATNTSKTVTLRVTLHDGTTLDGKLRFKKGKLEVKGRKTKKLLPSEVSSISVVPAPTREEQLEAFEKKKRRLGDDADAKAWVRLGRWARGEGLSEQAEAAFTAALERDPAHEDARAGLGKVKNDDGVWVAAEDFFRDRRREVKADDHDGLVALARLAKTWDQEELALGYLCEVLRDDIFHKSALELAAPLTAQRRQLTQPMTFPVRGRWLISPDRTRHHQRKSYAVYALDLNKVDAKGRIHTGKGRKLTDHHAWGAPYYAMAPGKVIEVRDGFPDNPIGKLKGKAEKHNGVSLDHGNGEFSWYVHARKGTAAVKVGDQVEAGQLLGEVGNSGGSGIPHLHVTLVAYRGISVPWTCDGFTLIAPDGTPIPVTRAWPREGWTVEVEEKE